MNHRRGVKDRAWALTDRAEAITDHVRAVWVPVRDIPQISDEDWQAMTEARLEAEE